MSKAIKFLVSGYESSGKSTLTSTLDNVLVVNFDKKEYNFPVPHVNYKEYKGMNDVVEFITASVQKYKDKFEELPKFVVIDTVTQLYSHMTAYNSVKFNGFTIHTQNTIDTSTLNDFIENVLISNGISVIIVAHTIVDADSGRHVIPAQGGFAKAGSWLSIVNDSLFIEKSSNKLIVYLQGFKYPTRSTLKDIPVKVPMEDFNFTEHLNKLLEQKEEALEFAL